MIQFSGLNLAHICSEIGIHRGEAMDPDMILGPHMVSSEVPILRLTKKCHRGFVVLSGRAR